MNTINNFRLRPPNTWFDKVSRSIGAYETMIFSCPSSPVKRYYLVIYVVIFLTAQIFVQTKPTTFLRKVVLGPNLNTGVTFSKETLKTVDLKLDRIGRVDPS